MVSAGWLRAARYTEASPLSPSHASDVAKFTSASLCLFFPTWQRETKFAPTSLKGTPRIQIT